MESGDARDSQSDDQPDPTAPETAEWSGQLPTIETV